VTIKAAALKRLVAHPEDLAGLALHPGPALQLLENYLRGLATLDVAPPSGLAETIGLHLVDLIAAALGPTPEAKEMIAKRGVKAARLQAVLSKIERYSSNLGFNLDSVAAELGLSRRYVQLLLEGTGKSFTEHVAESRLCRAHAMLSDPRFAHMGIVDIAFACGFGDISHFNRIFRRRFGETPSDVREAAGHDEK
jgi:AraC-like DNA-binding protein